MVILEKNDSQRFAVIEQSAEELLWDVRKLKNTTEKLEKSNHDLVSKITGLEQRLDSQSELLVTISETLRRLDPSHREARAADKAIATSSIDPNQGTDNSLVSPGSEQQLGYRSVADALATRYGIMKKVDMPVFNGTSPFGWIARVERYFRVGKHSDAQKLDLVSLSLEGPGLSWFNWEIEHENFRDWSDFKQRMLDRFGESRYEETGFDGTSMATVEKIDLCETLESHKQECIQQLLQVENTIFQELQEESKVSFNGEMDHFQSPMELVVGDFSSDFGFDASFKHIRKPIYVEHVKEEEGLNHPSKSVDDRNNSHQPRDQLALRELIKKKWRCFKFQRFKLKNKEMSCRWIIEPPCRKDLRKFDDATVGSTQVHGLVDVILLYPELKRVQQKRKSWHFKYKSGKQMRLRVNLLRLAMVNALSVDWFRERKNQLLLKYMFRTDYIHVKGSVANETYGAWMRTQKELLMYAAPISVLELTSEFLRCGVTAYAVFLSREDGLLQEYTMRRIKVVETKGELSYTSGMIIDDACNQIRSIEKNNLVTTSQLRMLYHSRQGQGELRNVVAGLFEIQNTEQNHEKEKFPIVWLLKLALEGSYVQEKLDNLTLHLIFLYFASVAKKDYFAVWHCWKERELIRKKSMALQFSRGYCLLRGISGFLTAEIQSLREHVQAGIYENVKVLMETPPEKCHMTTLILCKLMMHTDLSRMQLLMCVEEKFSLNKGILELMCMTMLCWFGMVLVITYIDECFETQAMQKQFALHHTLWRNLPSHESTWFEAATFEDQYPSFKLEDKLHLMEGGIDRY